MKEYKNVDAYINEADPFVQPLLVQMRQIVTELAPQAEERISYGMPAYFYHGALVYFGGFKDHVSLFGAGSNLHERFQAELKKYKTSKGTIQFPLDQPLPQDLIKKMVQSRVVENEAKIK